MNEDPPNSIFGFGGQREDDAVAGQERRTFLKPFSLARENPELFFGLAAAFAAVLFFQGGEPSLPVAYSGIAASAARSSANPFEEAGISAKAAFVYDVKMRRALFEKNADVPRPLASLTKLMTAATALSLIPETTLITIAAEDMQEEGDTGLRAGEEWILRDLLRLMLIESSNDAAFAVSSSVGTIAKGGDDRVVGREFFIDRMNENARALGFTGTEFANETGLDSDSLTAGAVGTAREAALLLAAVLAKSQHIFAATKWNEFTVANENGDAHTARNTNKDTDKFPLLLASKTGYTDLAGGNLLIAFDAGFNRPIIISVLGSSRDGRFADAEKLVWATLLYLTNNK